MKTLFDSSVLIAFFNRDDIFHKDTVNFISELIEHKEVIVILPVIVFLEVTNVLSRKATKFDAEALFDIFDTYEKLDLSFETAKSLIPILKQVHLKTSDAIIFVSAKLEDATIITWDEKFIKEAKRFVDIKTPKTFLEQK
ncbi:type II toxin-antitoxin system VapC family toxin [Candidatus Roizmanbacteria bacterium]|nr:type II toxin-antitoxin system VapC family toxin [Candidatus Roizmanbacteria bacterium]